MEQRIFALMSRIMGKGRISSDSESGISVLKNHTSAFRSYEESTLKIKIVRTETYNEIFRLNGEEKKR